jgi:hypothetical protein
MNTAKSAVAAVQALLMLPAGLFMGALVVRNLALPQSELARDAQRIVMWYSARQWTLWMLLIVLPLAVLVAGCLTLVSSGNDDLERPQAARQTLAAIHAPAATLSVGAATLVAAGVLAIVVVHMLAN